MKLILKVVLTNIAAFLVISSFVTITEGQIFDREFVPQKPISGGNLRLLSMEVPQSWGLSENVEYWATINFETDRKSADIRRACFNFSGDGQSCVDVQAKDVTYGLRPCFRVPIHIPVGTKRINCYAEYIRDGETQRTNTITYYVIVLKRPEE
jgi:hypothetical protein